jgi:hypothetical protein
MKTSNSNHGADASPWAMLDDLMKQPDAAVSLEIIEIFDGLDEAGRERVLEYLRGITAS